MHITIVVTKANIVEDDTLVRIFTTGVRDIMPSATVDGVQSPLVSKLSYNTVVLYNRNRYEIIGLRKSSDSIKQLCSSICLKKAFAMHQSC